MGRHLLTRREALQSVAALAAAPLAVPAVSAAPLTAAREQAFSSGWRFLRGDAKGAEQPEFNDTRWRALDVPHDWSIEDPPGRDSPFDHEASGGKASTGWVVGGAGWYRKRFSAQGIPQDRRVELRFDGVYMLADVWVNGKQAASHSYGYTPFAFDITDYLTRENDNVVAVRVRNEGRNSRWYSGSGVYRHVWITVTGDVRVPRHGVYVTTPEVSRGTATVRAAVKVENLGRVKRDVTVRLRLNDGGKAETVQAVAGGATEEASLTVAVASPRLWSAASPALYTATVELLIGGRVVDQTATPFGIRKVEIDAARGLRVNGEPVKLKGGCVHHDNGVLGAAAIDRAEERRVELLKASGFNAIRTSHNPPSPAFLDACDRLGMYVIDEAFDMWREPKNPEDYHLYFDRDWQADLDAMVLRDRNRPSVILWSIGNEIRERADPPGVEIAKKLAAEVKRLDSTRPVTAAICHFWEFPNRPWPESTPAFASLDVGGYNYEWREYEPDHAKFPERVMAGTESFPIEAFENWRMVEKHPYVIGDFVWTAIDYLGESGIGHTSLSGDPPEQLKDYPWFNAWCGDIDLIGEKKPQSYYRDVVWGVSQLEMAVHRPLPAGRTDQISKWGWPDETRSWTWPGAEGKPLRVRVFTSGDEVRLSLNGKEIGRKPASADTKLTAEFDVPYAPGELRAQAFAAGKPIASMALQTAGAPARLRLRADRSALTASRAELSYVIVEVVDERGVVVPDAVAPVLFKVSGSGELAAVGNASPNEMASYRKPKRNTFQGKCLAVLRPTRVSGAITLRAESPSLAAAELTVELKAR
ncbi:MAG: DUF4982 domain-containing protein [Acidobacteria bacterium]|nr:DUF4982 domain-containing protein [Acidobacteriota bacterium]